VTDPLLSPLAESVASRSEDGDRPVDAHAPTLASEATRHDASYLRRGESLGRYVVLSPLGEGGMGVVYSAYDPQLDRRVAVKLMRAEAAGSSGASMGRERLLREAQAIARLAHPNVVAVHDVGTYEGQVFVAMEFVDGVTLRAWLETPRTWREALAMFVQAGRGLGAAHAAGLVHRDFKPDNVLVGRDGRARVLDFGLAFAVARPHDPPPEPGSTPAPQRRGSLDTPLTEAGSLLGTPRYMAPEQFEGHRTDGAGDQFSFCIALFEALYGELPFEGDDLVSLSVNVRSGKLRALRAKRAVPNWVRASIARGLRTRPSDRYPTMDALLAALQADPAVPRRRTLYAAALVAVAGAAVAGILMVRAHRAPLCPSAAPSLAGAWDDARREQIRRAFRETRKPFAEDALRGVERALDSYASAWVTMHGEVCTATRVRGEQSNELMDLRMACLNDRLAGLRALTEQLSRADGALVEQSFRAAFALEPIRSCTDVAALRSPTRMPADAAARESIGAVREQLARAHAIGYAARPLDGLALARQAVQAAETTGYAPVRAEALETEGDLLVLAGQYKPAASALRGAILAAEASRHEAIETRAWIDLAMAYAKDVDPAGAEAALHAHACLDRQGGDAVRAARLASTEGEIEYNADRVSVAADLEQRAISMLEHQDPPDPVLLVQTLNRLSTAQGELGQLPEAMATAQRAVDIATVAFGPEHPLVGSAVQSLATSQARRGQLEAAESNCRRALSIKIGAFGDDALAVANTLGNLGLVLSYEHKNIDALDVSQRALAIRLARLGPDHPDVALSYGVLGDIQVDLNRLDDALESARRQLAITEKTDGPDSPLLAPPLTMMGRVLRAKGDSRAALPYLERAAKLGEGRGGEPEKLASTRFDLAKAILATHGDRQRAWRLAGQARATYASLDGDFTEAIREIDSAFPPGGR
jgi:tetratricopeptide (TPR) repeat protein/predicted Ser/Thr protein kinase